MIWNFRTMIWNLRTRIALWFAIIAAAFVGLAFAIIYVVVHQANYDHLDDELITKVHDVWNNFAILDDSLAIVHTENWREGDVDETDVNPMFKQVVDLGSHVVRKSGNLRENTLPSRPFSDDSVYFNDVLSGFRIRLVQVPIVAPNKAPVGSLLVAMPSEGAETVMEELQLVLLVSYPIILTALFAVSRFIAGKIVAPVSRVISTAERITEHDLGERIALPPVKDELHRFASTLNGLLDRCQSALTREQQFTQDVSHELLTPLASLRGTLDVLIRRPRTAEHYTSRIAACLQEIDGITRMVDQLLMIARADSGVLKPTLGPVDLSERLSVVLQRLEPLLVSRGVHVAFSARDGLIVKADGPMTDRILENILSNAIKYSPTRSSIEIELKRDIGTTALSIIDTGIGMSNEEQKRIFDRFYRADSSRSSHVSGFGLGLSIVKRLTELQKIQISVQSEPTVGTTFTLTFQS